MAVETGLVGKTLQVIVVDNDPVFARQVEMAICRRLGGEIVAVVVGTPAEAVRVMKSEPIALVLTDLDTGETNGLHLLSWIKQFFPQVPVIVFTEYADRETERNAYELGADEYLVKPLEISSLMKSIASHLDRSKAQLAGQATTPEDQSCFPIIESNFNQLR